MRNFISKYWFPISAYIIPVSLWALFLYSLTYPHKSRINVTKWDNFVFSLKSIVDELVFAIIYWFWLPVPILIGIIVIGIGLIDEDQDDNKLLFKIALFLLIAFIITFFITTSSDGHFHI